MSRVEIHLIALSTIYFRAEFFLSFNVDLVWMPVLILNTVTNDILNGLKLLMLPHGNETHLMSCEGRL
jgi:hypothetical protein